VDTVQIIGWGAAAGVAASAVVRLIETRNSEHVSGVAPGWAWGALLGNIAWFFYGIFLPEPKQAIPSVVWFVAAGYVLWRVHKEGRDQRRNLVFATSVSVAMFGVAVLSPAVIGFAAGLIITASAMPQTIRIWRTFDREGIAPVAWIFSLALSVMWFVYGFSVGLPEIWITNVLFGTLAALILIGAAVSKKREKLLVGQ
jgi:uncharacterized protein with PQ loop repeat